MREPSDASHWTRHLLPRSDRVRTTWKFRAAVAVFIAGSLWLTSGWWTAAIGRSLVCEGNAAASDAILIENFDPDYLLFERATALRRAGLGARVLVPIRMDGDGQPNAVSAGTARLMADIAHLGTIEPVLIRTDEPVSLTAARHVRQFLERENIRSVIVLSPIFRSSRSALIYRTTLGRAGIAVRCEPVQGTLGVETWTSTLHGIQAVTEQWLKLQYYRLYVLPFRAGG